MGKSGEINIKYSKYFSRGAALSPSLWVYGGVPDFVKNAKYKADTRLYMDYGIVTVKHIHYGKTSAVFIAHGQVNVCFTLFIPVKCRNLNAGYSVLFRIIKQACSREAVNAVPKNLPVLFVAGANDPVGGSHTLETAAHNYCAAEITAVLRNIFTAENLLPVPRRSYDHSRVPLVAGRRDKGRGADNSRNGGVCRKVRTFCRVPDRKRICGLYILLIYCFKN